MALTKLTEVSGGGEVGTDMARSSRTPKNRAEFLAALETTGNVTLATGHVVREQGCSLDSAPGLGGGISRIAVELTLWCAIADTQMCYRFRNTLKKLRIINLVQIGSVICSLAVLSAKGSELWGRCCDGTR